MPFKTKQVFASTARTVSLHTDGRTIIVDPNTNLAASITYTVTVTNSVRGRYDSSYVPGVQNTIYLLQHRTG
jgi:Bacterial Ig-like domain